MGLRKIDTVVVWPYNGRNDYGEENFGDAVELSCRIDTREFIQTDNEGDERTTETVIYFDGDQTDLNRGDRIYNTTLDALTDDDFENSWTVREINVDRNPKGTKALYTARLKKP